MPPFFSSNASISLGCAAVVQGITWKTSRPGSESEWVEVPEFPAGVRWSEWPPGVPDSHQIA